MSSIVEFFIRDIKSMIFDVFMTSIFQLGKVKSVIFSMVHSFSKCHGNINHLSTFVMVFMVIITIGVGVGVISIGVGVSVISIFMSIVIIGVGVITIGVGVS